MTFPKPPSPISRVFLFFGFVVAAVGLVQWTLHLASLDPFAAFRNPDTGPLGSLIGVRMDNAKIKFFRGAEEVGSCVAGRIDVQRNRQFLDFYMIGSGTYRGPNGMFDFRADRAQWNANRERMVVMSGAEVHNKDMNLVTDTFEYNKKTGLLFIGGKVRGELFGGKVVASRMTYSLQDGSYATGPVEWVGLAALSAEDTGGEATKKSNWKFKASGVSRDKTGQNEIFTNAEASDGEVIVKAPKIERTVKTDVLVATGKVFYYSLKSNMTCDKAVVYRKEKRAVLTGNVQMILKPTQEQKLEVVEIAPFRPQVPDEIAKDRPPAPPQKTEADKKLDDEVRTGKSARKYPITILADKIEYWYGKGSRRAVIDGNPQARQDLAAGRWRYAWTWQALYDGEKETLRMVSSTGKKDTHVKTSLGDDFIADWFEFSTEDGNEEFSAQGIEGEFFSDEEEVPKLDGGDKKADDKKNGGKGNAKPPFKGWIGGG